MSIIESSQRSHNANSPQDIYHLLGCDTTVQRSEPYVVRQLPIFPFQADPDSDTTSSRRCTNITHHGEESCAEAKTSQIHFTLRSQVNHVNSSSMLTSIYQQVEAKLLRSGRGGQTGQMSHMVQLGGHDGNVGRNTGPLSQSASVSVLSPSISAHSTNSVSGSTTLKQEAGSSIAGNGYEYEGYRSYGKKDNYDYDEYDGVIATNRRTFHSRAPNR